MSSEEVPPGYRKTDVGVIPEDWDVKKIGEITTCTSGGTPNTEIASYWGGDIPWMSSGELHLKFVKDVRGRITDEGLHKSSAKIIPKNCILIGLAGQGKTRGTVAINLIEICTNQSIGAILPNSNFFPEYLYHNFNSRYGELRDLSTGAGGRGGLNLSIIKLIKIPLPPLPEQRAIAAALSDADALITSLDTLIAEKRAIKQAAMQQLLTGRKRLPGFEGEWKEVDLKDLAAITMGQSPQSKFYNVRADGLPLIQGNADIENRRTIERVWTTQASKRCDAGDLLLTVRAPVGTVGIAVKDACLGRGVCGLKPLCDSGFLYHALVYAEPRWKVFEQGSTFTAANSKQVGQFTVCGPKDRDEQHAIATVLSDMDAEITALEERRDKVKQIKQGMMQQLLTGKVRLVTPQEAEAAA